MAITYAEARRVVERRTSQATSPRGRQDDTTYIVPLQEQQIDDRVWTVDKETGTPTQALGYDLAEREFQDAP